MTAKLRRPGRRFRWVLAILLVGVLGVTSTGCKLTESVEEARQTAILVMQDAQNRLAAESANWQQTLEQLQQEAREWSKEVIAEIGAELNSVVNRAVFAAGEQFSCRVDFLAGRISDGLQRIIDRLRGKVTVVVPQVCGANPNQVRLDLPAGQRRVLEWSGYDFDVAGIRAVLTNVGQDVTEGQDLSRHLTRQSPYHLSLALGGPGDDQGVQLGDRSDRLVLLWNGRELSTVKVDQPTPLAPQACKRERLSIPVADVQYTPPHVHGDQEFFGHVDILVRTSAGLVNATTIEATIYMKAEQFRDDKTRAEGEEVVTLVSAAQLPANRRIETVVSNLAPVEYTYHDDDRADDLAQIGGTELVSSYLIQGDRDGPDAGVYTSVTVYFNNIVVDVVETGTCAL